MLRPHRSRFAGQCAPLRRRALAHHRLEVAERSSAILATAGFPLMTLTPFIGLRAIESNIEKLQLVDEGIKTLGEVEQHNLSGNVSF
ncbi:hypothetical protein [Burkholderia ubonensis]|uniref:hypothetical protein n=1 Tax=Burkholderia ubonensis TaxID=101571 RepID=UPI001160DCF6|nr:hypothetical protein [Burkholderia ubonensis]